MNWIELIITMFGFILKLSLSLKFIRLNLQSHPNLL